MDKEKSDYLKGLLYFGCLIICVCLFFTTPDGDTLFYELLRLFGISPGIRIGHNGILYAYMLAPGAASVIFAIKMFGHWKNYRDRFKGLHPLLRFFPVFIAVLIYLAVYGIHPSAINRAYYSELSRREGLQSISFYAPDTPFQFRTDETGRTYSYVFTLANHGDEPLQFNVELLHHNSAYLSVSDTLVKDANGEPMVFTLYPKQISRFIGEFTEPQQTDYISGNGFSIAMINGDERIEPPALVERPNML